MADEFDGIRKAARELSRVRKRPCLVIVAFPICEHRPPVVSGLVQGCGADAMDVVIDSPGGDIKEAYLTLREIRRQVKHLAIFVPLMAKSAATLICLGADDLVLGEMGELGPLDTQVHERQHGDFPRNKSCLERFKALEHIQRHAIETFDLVSHTIMHESGMRPLEAYGIAAEFTGKVCGPMYSQIDPATLGQDARYLEVGKQYAERVMKRYRPDLADRAEDIIGRLVRGYPTHDFAIDLEELAELGLPARQVDQEEVAPIEAMADDLRDLRPVLWDETSEHGIVELFDAMEAAAESGPAEIAANEDQARESQVAEGEPATLIRKVK